MTLDDGCYMTKPKWGCTQRIILVEDGLVRVKGSDHRFNQRFFFDVNVLLYKLDEEPNA